MKAIKYEDVLDPSKGTIRTLTGLQFSFIDPKPEQIRLIDIANALSKICHFGAQIHSHFSIAQHSLLVAEIVPDDLKAIALLHDAAEAYTGDIVKPLKLLLPGFKEIEDNITKAIFTRFNLPFERLPEIKEADKKIQALEADTFWNGVKHFECLTWYDSYREYFSKAIDLKLNLL